MANVVDNDVRRRLSLSVLPGHVSYNYNNNEIMMTTPTTIMTIIKMYGGNNIHLSKSPSHVVNSKSGYNGVGSYGALRHVLHPSYFFRKAFN